MLLCVFDISKLGNWVANLGLLKLNFYIKYISNLGPDIKKFKNQCHMPSEMRSLSKHFIRHLCFLDLLVICCCSLSTLRFDTLWVLRGSSAYHSCHAWSFALLLSSCLFRPVWPFSDLSRWQRVLARRTSAHWIFLVFTANTRLLCVKILGDQHFPI